MQQIDLTALPEVITRYLRAHRERDVDTAATAFRTDAVVQDDGSSHRGVAAIRAWLRRSSTEYSYTIEPRTARVLDDLTYVVTQHLEGNFPGGVVDLGYRFTVSDDLITALAVEPGA